MKYEIHPDGTMTLNPAYTEILRLDKMLTEKGIDHQTERLYDGYRVGVNYDGREIGDAVQHYFSYGSAENLLETMGFGEDNVTGRRTAEDVMAVVEAAIERKRERILQHNDMPRRCGDIEIDESEGEQ